MSFPTYKLIAIKELLKMYLDGKPLVGWDRYACQEYINQLELEIYLVRNK